MQRSPSRGKIRSNTDGKRLPGIRQGNQL